MKKSGVLRGVLVYKGTDPGGQNGNPGQQLTPRRPGSRKSATRSTPAASAPPPPGDEYRACDTSASSSNRLCRRARPHCHPWVPHTAARRHARDPPRVGLGARRRWHGRVRRAYVGLVLLLMPGVALTLIVGADQGELPAYLRRRTDRRRLFRGRLVSVVRSPRAQEIIQRQLIGGEPRDRAPHPAPASRSTRSTKGCRTPGAPGEPRSVQPRMVVQGSDLDPARGLTKEQGVA